MVTAWQCFVPQFRKACDVSMWLEVIAWAFGTSVTLKGYVDAVAPSPLM